MKQLILNIEKNKARLELVSGRKVLDSLEWEEDNSLSRLLMVKIDEILRKNKLAIDNILKFDIISDVPKNWTSCRIAEITFDSLMIAGLAR